MKYKFLIMAVLMNGGLTLLSCNQQEKSQQAEETTGNDEAAVEEDDVIVSKEKDWSERVIVFKDGVSMTDTLTLYRDGTAANNVSYSTGGNYSFKGYWELGSFNRGDMQIPAIKVNFSTEYSSNVYFMEANSHEGDYVYRKYESMLRKTGGYEIILEEVYR